MFQKVKVLVPATPFCVVKCSCKLALSVLDGCHKKEKKDHAGEEKKCYECFISLWQDS